MLPQSPMVSQARRWLLGSCVLLGFWAGAGLDAAAAPGNLEEWGAHILSLKRWAQREPNNPNHYLRIAQAYSQIGDSDNVLEYAGQARRRGAHPAQGYLLVGDHFFLQHRFAKAIDNYVRAWREAPANDKARTGVWLALYKLRLANQSSNQDLVGLAVELDEQGYYFPHAWRRSGPPPREVAARAHRHAMQGNRLLERGDLDAAVRAFQVALDAKPSFAEAFRGLGIAHARQRRIERALGAYTLFLAQAAPDHPDVPRIRKIILDYYKSRSRSK